MPMFSYTISDTGTIFSSDARTAEVTLRDLWKNVEPWLNEPHIEVLPADAPPKGEK